MTPGEGLKPVDPATNPRLSGRMAPVHDECDTTELSVEGGIPRDVHGTYMRNGPNPKFPPLGSYTFPLDGDGMVHAVTIDDGKVRYRNRFVETLGLRSEERAGGAIYGGILTPSFPDKSLLGPEPDPNWPFKASPFINVLRHDGRYLAFDEAAQPYELTADLETVGSCDFGSAIPRGTCAHPRIDPATGEMVLFTYAFDEPFLTWEAVGRDGTVTVSPRVVDGVDRPHMVHDCTITPEHLVLVVAPVVFDPDAIAGGGGDVLAWKPELGTRIAVVARADGTVRWIDTDAFWVWHFANAFADGHELVVDFPWISRFNLHGAMDEPATTKVVRLRLDPDRGRADFETLDDRLTEFPRIDDRLTGRKHRYFAVAHRSNRAGITDTDWDALVRYDTERGTAEVRPGDGEVFGEPAFAPREGSTGETDGYWMTFTNSLTDDTSWFVILDADDITADPVARVRMPQRVPRGLHGNWIPAT